MTTLYKLTDEDGRTYNRTQWGENVTHVTNGQGRMCGPGWLHAYTSAELAVLLNPIHADFNNPRLWIAEGIIGETDHGLKVGTTKLTVIREIDIPKITLEQRNIFALLCASSVYRDSQFLLWVLRWIDGTDRSERAAESAARAAESAAWAAARAAAYAAESAAIPLNLDELAKLAINSMDLSTILEKINHG